MEGAIALILVSIGALVLKLVLQASEVHFHFSGGAVQGGGWEKQPVLTLNGVAHRFDTADGYIALIEAQPYHVQDALAGVLQWLRSVRHFFLPHSTAVDPAQYVSERPAPAFGEKVYTESLPPDLRAIENTLRALRDHDAEAFQYWRSKAIATTAGGADEYLATALSATALSQSFNLIAALRGSRPLRLLPGLIMEKLLDGLEAWEHLFSFSLHPEIHPFVRPAGSTLPAEWDAPLQKLVEEHAWTGTQALDAHSLEVLQESSSIAELHHTLSCFSHPEGSSEKAQGIPWRTTAIYLAKLVAACDDLPPSLVQRCKDLALQCGSQVDPWTYGYGRLEWALEEINLSPEPHAPLPKALRPIVFDLGDGAPSPTELARASGEDAVIALPLVVKIS